MRTGRPGHLASFDYIGFHRYSLTFCTHRRQKLFTNAEIVRLVLTQISRASAKHLFGVIAYCFMPDHLHLLVAGQAPDSACKPFIALVKQYSGYHYSEASGSRLWQRYGFEHTLRDEELTLIVAKYILENPIRAGLVDRVHDYPFVGSLVYSLDELLLAIAAASPVRRRSG